MSDFLTWKFWIKQLKCQNWLIIPTNSAEQIKNENSQNGDRRENHDENYYDDAKGEEVYEHHYEGLEEGGYENHGQ